MSFDVLSFVSDLRRQGIHLERDDLTLRFRCLPGVLTEAQREQIRIHRDEILAFLAQNTTWHDDQPIDYPATVAQRDIYLATQLPGAEATYNMPQLITVPEELDRARLQQAVHALVVQHSALRTTFHSVEGAVVQRVHPRLPVEVERLGDEFASFIRPFDIEKGPLVRIGCRHGTGGVTSIAIDLHHLVGDENSIGVIRQDLLSAYGGVALKPLRYTLGHYAISEQRTLTTPNNRDREYWAERVKRLAPDIDFGRFAPSLPVSSDMVVVAEATLDNEGSSAETAKFMQREHVSPFALLIASQALVLGRWAGVGELVACVPTDLRRSDSLRKVIGPFVNVLPISIPIPTDTTLGQFVMLVRDALFEAVEHGSHPCAESWIREQSRRLRSSDVTCLRHVVAGPADQTPTLRPTSTRFPLSFTLLELTACTKVHLECSPRIMDAHLAQTMADQIAHVWRQILAGPERAPRDVFLAAPAELRRLEAYENGEVCNYPDRRVDELFDHIAARSPDDIALSYRGTRVTFRAVAERSDQVAAALSGLGVKHNDIVAIRMERSEALPIVILGIIKAGAAYLPIDPRDPPDRVAFLLSDSRARIVVTESLAGISGGEGIRVVLPEELAAAAPAHFPRSRRMDGLAYVIYTSGSTGRPKGVMIEHGGIVNRLAWMAQQYGVGAGDVILHKTPYTFDVSVWELLLGFVSGAATLVLEPGAERDPDAICHAIVSGGVTLAHFVPTMLHEFLRILPEGLDWGRWRHCICSGEALRPDQARIFFEKLGRVRLHNLYGPTEASVDVSFHEVRPGDALVPIGKPVANTQLFIVDSCGQRCSPGVPGELCIAGIQLARGYLDRAELTARSFVADSGGGRYYRTGDLARWLPNGTVEYLGRIDHQVKIRGQRIELEEIEAALTSCGGVTAAAVRLWDIGADAALCGYIVVQGGLVVASEQIRQDLERRLPPHMVPATIMAVPELPLTSSGKLDRQRLPRPVVAPDHGAAANITDATTATIAAIFAEVLGVPGVSATTEFFRAGGHSLKALRVIWNIEQATGVKLSVANFFRAPTPDGLADLVKRSASPRWPHIPRAPWATAYPVTSPQKRMYVLQQFGQELLYNIPAVFELTGELDRDRFAATLRKLVHRHEALRTSFHADAGGVVQKIWLEADIEVRYREKPEGTLGEMAADFIQPFDLGTAPLARIQLVRLDENRHLLWFDLHHIIADELSFEVLIRDFALSYAGLALGPDPVQPKDHAIWLRSDEATLDRARQERYWVAKLQRPPIAAALPGDCFPTTKARAAGSVVRRKLRPELMTSIAKLCRDGDLTLFMCGYAAYAAALARYCGDQDIVVGTIASGRDHPALSRTVGMLANTLALRLRVDHRATGMDLLTTAKATVAEALESQTYPFEELLERVAPGRDWTRHPLFRALLTYKNEADAEVKLPRLTISRPGELPVQAKFDLSLTMDHGADGVELRFEYANAQYSSGTVEAFADCLTNFLARLTEAPRAAVAELWAGADRARPRATRAPEANEPAEEERSLATLFEGQSALFPQAVAVASGPAPSTYEQINRMANQRARWFMSLGVKAGERVRPALDTTVRFVVDALAIWKIGATVDLSPTEQTLESGYEDVTLQAFGTENLPADPGAASAAFRIAAAGGSGDDCVISHRSAARLVGWYRERVDFQPGDRMVVCHCLDSIAAQKDVWLALLSGGTVVRSWGRSFDVAATVGDLTQAAPPVLNCSAHMLAALLAHEESSAAWGQTLRGIVVSGSPVSPDLLKRVQTRVGPRTRIHAVSDAGASGDIVLWQEVVGRPTGLAPLGLPLPGFEVHLLDSQGAPVPRGAVGRLHVAERIRSVEGTAPTPPPEPLRASPYFARCTPDGQFVRFARREPSFSGFGISIEPWEIELAVGRDERVDDVCVVMRSGEEARSASVFYVGKVRPLELRRRVAQILPEYHLPASWIELDRLPLDRNGDVDFGSLPKPTSSQESTEAESLTVQESQLAEIWRSVLGVPRVQRHDNFFHLGGDSIKAMQVVARLRAAGVAVRHRELFEAEDLATAALLLGGACELVATPWEHGLSPVLPVHRWFAALPLSRRSHWNQSGAVRLKRRVDVATWRRVWADLAKHHDILRAVWLGEGPSLRVRPTSEFQTELSEFVPDASQPLPEQIRGFAQRLHRSLDLERGPLVRIGVVDLGVEQALIFVAHHVIVDGVSWRILCDDLLAALMQVREGGPAPAWIRGTSFARWVSEVQAYARTPALAAEIPYWTSICGAETREIPALRAHPTVADCSAVEVRWDPSETSRLLAAEMPGEDQSTLSALLLAATAGALRKAWGAGPCHVMLEHHGREPLFPGIDVSRTVGWFTSLFPLLLPVSDAGGSALRLREVAAALQAVPGNGFGYSILRYDPSVPAEVRQGLRVAPQICFNYLGRFDAIEHPDLQPWNEDLGPACAPEDPATFPLEMNFAIRGGALHGRFQIAADAAAADRFVNAFQNEVRQILQALAEGETDRAPAHFTKKGLSEADLETLLSLNP